MDVKRIFRGPWFWIVVAVVGVLVALQYLAPNGGYDEVDTSEMAQYIDDGAGRGDHLHRRRPGDPGDARQRRQDGGSRSVPLHPGPAGDLIEAVRAGVPDGTIEKYNSENPQPSLLGSLLATFLPFVLIILLFLFLMNQVQGGGGRASCSSASPRPS